MGKKETLGTPRWEETEEITTSVPSWEDTEEVKKKVQPVSGESGLGVSGQKSAISTTESVSEVPSTLQTKTAPETWADRAARLIKENAPKSQQPITSKVKDIRKKVNANLVESQINPIEKDMMFGGRNPFYEIVTDPSKEIDATTQEDALGMDYWIIRGGKRGEENKYETVIADMNGSRPRQLPADMRKVMDDYMKHLAINEPDKFKTLSIVKDYKGSPIRKGTSEIKESENDYYIDLTEGAKRIPKEIARYIQNDKIRSLNYEDEAQLLFDALRHQQNILLAEYSQRKEGGGDPHQLNQDFLAASNALSDMQSQIIEENRDFKKVVDRQIQAQKTADEKQKIADLQYEQYYKENPLLASVYYGVGQPVKESIKSTMRDIYSLPANLGVADLSAFAGYADKAADPDITPTQLQGSLYDEDGFHFEKTLNRVTRTGADMVTLLAGSKGLGTLTRAGYKPALFGTSYAMTYNDYYDEAIAAGLTPDQADSHAQRSAALTSALELVSPNLNLTQGLKSELTKETVANLAKGMTWKNSFKEALKTYSKEIPKENIQELMQLVGDKYQAAVTNEMSGRQAIDTQIAGEEIGETMFLTSIVTGIGNMRALKSPNALQKSTLYQSIENYNEMIELMEKGVKDGNITKEQAQATIEGVDEAKQIVVGLPQDLKLNAKQKMDLADIIYQKKKLSEQVDNEYVDDVFKKEKEEEIAAKKAALDNQMKAIVNQYDVQVEFEKQKKEGEKSAREGKIVQEEYGAIVREYAKTLNEDQFVETMMEEDFGGEIPEEEARKYYKKQYEKINQDDKADITGFRGAVQEGQATEQKEPIEEGGGQTSEAGRVLEKTPEGVIAPLENLIPTQDLTTKDRAIIDDIKASIEKGEPIEPIEVSEGAEGKLNIEDGHHRYVAYSEMGIKDVPIVMTEPTISDAAPQEEQAKKKWSDDIINTLDNWDNDLKQFGKETVGMNIPVVIGRGAVKVMKAAVQTAQSIDDVVRAGVDYIKASKWYQNLSDTDKQTVDENLATNAYDVIMQKGKTKEELAQVRAQQKGVEQGYRQGIAEGKLGGEIAGMKKGIKEGVKRGRVEEKIRIKEREAAQEKGRQANSVRKKIKKKIRAKQMEKISVFAGDKVLLNEFVNINPLYVDNVDEYNEIAAQILNNITSPKVKATGVTKAERELSNADIKAYIERQQPLQEQAKKDRLAQQYQELVDVGAIDPATMSLAEMQQMIDELTSGALTDADIEANMFLKEQEEKRKQMVELVRQKIRAMQFLKEKDDSGSSTYEDLNELEKEMFDALSQIEPENFTLSQLVGLNNVVENININGSFDGAGKYWAMATAQKSIEELSRAQQQIGAYVKNDLNVIKKSVASVPQALQYIANNTEYAAKLFGLSGIQGITSGYSQMNTWMRDKYFEQLQKLHNVKGIRRYENVLTRGMYAFVIQHEGGTIAEIAQEFERRKSIIEQDIAEKKKSRNTNLRKEGEALQEIYNTLLDGANSIEEVRARMNKDNLAIVDFHINDVFASTKEELQQNSRIFNNQAIDEWENYTPTSYKTTKNSYDESILSPGENAFLANTINTRQAKAAINRQKNKSLPKGKLLNYDFDNIMERRLRDTLYEIYTQRHRQLFVEFMKTPQVTSEEVLGSSGNVDFLNDQVKEMINTQLRIYKSNSEIWKQINKVLNILSAKGARQVLAGISQPLSQALPVTVRTFINSNFDFRVWTRLMGAARNVDNNLFLYGSLLERKDTQAGLRRTVLEDEIARTEIQSAFSKISTLVGDAGQTVADKLFYTLQQSDFAAAKAAWMSYYAQYMKKMGVKKIDWKEEAINPNREASAYAELMVATTQNINDFTQASRAARRTKGAEDALRNIFMPFSSFSVNNRAAIMLNVQKLRTGDHKARTEAAKDLGGALVEGITFNAIKIFLLAAAYDEGSEWLLSTFFDFSEEEIAAMRKEKTLDQKINQLLAQSGTDFVMGGTGSLPENLTKEGVNWVFNEVTGQQKGVIPIYKNDEDGFNWDLMGAYGIPLKSLIDTYPYIKYAITGNYPNPQTIRDETGKLRTIYVDEPMTDRQRRFMTFYSIINLGAIVGVSDRDVLSVFRKAEKIVRKDIEKTRGRVYEVELAAKGEEEKKQSGSRPQTRGNVRQNTRTKTR